MASRKQASTASVSAAPTETQPWPKPVAGVALVTEIINTFGRYVIMPEMYRLPVALWVLFSHTLDAFNYSPRLVFTSRDPGCGKTTSLKLLAALSASPLPMANVTSAFIFRAIEKWKPTLLLDEADTYMEQSEDMRGILNSGHDRENAWVGRCHPESNEPMKFTTWAPISIAKIGGLSPTLHSRSIIVPLHKVRGAHLMKWQQGTAGALTTLRQKCLRWAADNLETLRDADPSLSSRLDPRMADNWRPIFAIADAVGRPYARRIRGDALRIAERRDAAQSPADETAAFVRSKHRGSKRPVPEYVIRHHIGTLVKTSRIADVWNELVEAKRILKHKDSKPTAAVYVPGVD